MKEKTLKSISKLLVAVMIATIALPSGAFAGHGNYKQDKVMAAEVSIADSEQETTKENTETTKPAEETSTDEVVLRKQELMKHLQQKSHQQLKQQHRHRQQKCQQQKLLQVTLIS